MKSISGEIYIIKRLNHGIVKGKQVNVLEGVVMKHIDIEPFRRGNGEMDQCSMITDWSLRILMSGRRLLQRYWGDLNALRLPWLSGR